MVDAHKITEQTSLLSHRLYAEVIDEDHRYIGQARALLEQRLENGQATIGEQHWQQLLQRPWTEIRQHMLEDTAAGRLLRSNSPFSFIIGISDPDVRRQLWRQAKNELSAATT